MKRKLFLKQLVMGAGTFTMVPHLPFAQTMDTKKQIGMEPLLPEKVKEFVVAGHGDFAKTKQLLQEIPSLLYATWDWGGGDFETALEGAGHVGNKEIAHYLIATGARTNLFVLTMLGKTQLVKYWLENFPEYINAKGPHGFTLLHHAQKGGEDARELFDYLQSKGLKEFKVKL